MPTYSAADGMIRAFQMGLNERRAKEDQAAEQERKKIEVDLLQHRVKQIKLAERIEAWDFNVKGKEAQAKSFEGLPEAEMDKAGMMEGLPSRDLSQSIVGLMPSAQASQPPVAGAFPPAPQPQPVAGVPIAANQPRSVRPVMTPAFNDPESGRSAPSIALRPRTKEQLDRAVRDAADLKNQTEAVTLGPNQKRFVGGKLVAEGGEDPSDAITKAHYERMDAIEKAKAAQAAAQGKSYITATIRQSAAKDLYDNIDALETAFAPDPKDVVIREAEAADWEATDPAKRVGTKPRPVPNRMSPSQLESRKLAAINSYRSQIGLPSYQRTPPDWSVDKEIAANPPDGASGAQLDPGVPPPPPNENDMVMMVSPTGETKNVLKTDVEFYESYGAKLYIPPGKKASGTSGAIPPAGTPERAAYIAQKNAESWQKTKTGAADLVRKAGDLRFRR